MNVFAARKAVQTRWRLDGDQTTRVTVGLVLLSATSLSLMIASFAL